MSIQDFQLEIKFFDQHAEDHGYYIPFDENGYKTILKQFISHFPAHIKKICLVDLGCGTGEMMKRLAQACDLEIIGCDISRKCVALAQSASSGSHYAQANILETPFADETFDVVTCCGVLHHFPKFGEVLKEVYRILVPEGVLMAYDPNLYNPAMWLYRDPHSPFFSQVGKTGNEILLTRKMLLKEINKVGFKEVKIKASGGVTFNFVESKKAQKFIKAYNFFENFSRYIPGVSHFGSMIFSFAKK